MIVNVRSAGGGSGSSVVRVRTAVTLAASPDRPSGGAGAGRSGPARSARPRRADARRGRWLQLGGARGGRR